jgi:aryl-alcohol dehydrogenase-like predicted oxidoreductase
MEVLPTRRFGKTDEQTTALGLGGAVLTRSSYADGVATVRRAYELGIRYFDTSPGYCDNLSQPVMGEGLDDIPSALDGETMLATKVGYMGDPADFRSEDAVRRQIEDNLRLLRRDRVDVLQVHEANMTCWWEDGAASPWIRIADDQGYRFEDAPVLSALRKAKEEGLCRHIGITGNVAHQMSRVLRGVTVDTFLVAFSYDLIVRDAEIDAFPLAAQKGVALILGAVYYGGRLVQVHEEWLRDPPAWMTPALRDRFARLYEIQRACGIPLVQLALRYALARDEASTVLVGAKTPAEIEEAVAAARDGPLPHDLHAEIDALGMQTQ